MPKHTPGPWIFDGFDVSIHDGLHEYHDSGAVIHERADGRLDTICNVNGNDPDFSSMSAEEVEANAVLIAMAPTLLDLLVDAGHALADAKLHEGLRRRIDFIISALEGQ
jgi:hypothetical protein